MALAETDAISAELLDASLIADLPEEIFSALIRIVPQRELWKWLQTPDRGASCCAMPRAVFNEWPLLCASRKCAPAWLSTSSSTPRHSTRYSTSGPESQPTPHAVAAVWRAPRAPPRRANSDSSRLCRNCGAIMASKRCCWRSCRASAGRPCWRWKHWKNRPSHRQSRERRNPQPRPTPWSRKPYSAAGAHRGRARKAARGGAALQQQKSVQTERNAREQGARYRAKSSRCGRNSTRCVINRARARRNWRKRKRFSIRGRAARAQPRRRISSNAPPITSGFRNRCAANSN